MTSMISSGCSNVIVETLKACEDSENAFIARIYEAEGTYTHADIRLGFMPRAVELTNMLEEKQEDLPAEEVLHLTFRPFEIKTVKISY